MKLLAGLRRAHPALPDETVLWRGRPHWWAAARRIWHLRLVGAYFVLLLLDGLSLPLRGDGTWHALLPGELKLVVMAAAALGVLLALAGLSCCTTSYTVTDRRVVLRYGMALQATLAIPFGAIEHVAIRVHGDHTGELALRLRQGDGKRLGWAKLWPHVRSWRLLRPEPMLRSVPQVAVVGVLLSRAMAASQAAATPFAAAPDLAA